jgi:hemerythrin
MDDDIITWNAAYSVGIEFIDNQHKELVRMTNALFTGCRRGGTLEDVAFLKTLRNAVEYAQTHFATEEKYMRQTNYPDLPAHKAEHEAFVAEVRKQIKTFDNGTAEPLKLARFLKDWLLNHIAVSDKKYTPYFEGLTFP